MFRIISCLCACTLLLASCTSAIKNEEGRQPEETPVVKSETPAAPPGNSRLIVENQEDIAGYWVGMFEPDTNVEGIYAGERHAWDYSNKINIAIGQITGDSVTGHSVVAGNNRPFKGKVLKEGNTYRFLLKEPGDDKYDGVFECSIGTGDSILVGTWKANRQVRISKRKYRLQKKIFRYNPNQALEPDRYVDWTKHKEVKYVEDEDEAYFDKSYFVTTDDVTKYNSSGDLLQAKQVANMKKADLFILRNAIYARHGYSFKNQQLRAYFDRQPWYIPVSADIKSEFTDIEKKNIELLLRYEKNAKEYYDVFGRG